MNETTEVGVPGKRRGVGYFAAALAASLLLVVLPIRAYRIVTDPP